MNEFAAALWTAYGWWSWIQALCAIEIAEWWLEMDDQSERERAMMEEWTRSAMDAAVYAGLIQPPWRPGEHVYSALHGYFSLGMTPAQGAEALFATRH